MHMNPVLQPLSSRHQDAISDLLRRSGQPGCPAPHVATIGHQSFGNGWDIASPAMLWMAGVYLAGELAGFVQVHDGPLEGRPEARLFVDAKWRRQGLGTLLLKATMDWASLREANMLRLVCTRTDWPMRHFAGKFGARLDLVLGHLVADFPLGQRIHEQQRAIEVATTARQSR
jgi:GNAT superfamily N-acetyltransferase